MYRFFRPISKLSDHCRLISTGHAVTFDVKGSMVKGELIKIILQDMTCSITFLNQAFTALLRNNPNNLFIMTIASKMLRGEHGAFPYPGHNSAFITDAQGCISSFISKRPDLTQAVTVRKRMPDDRFPDSYSPKIRIYPARFTSFAEEQDYWLNIAKNRMNFPLFIHRIPLDNELGIDAATFNRNVEYILDVDRYYSLHSTVHPIWDRCIPAENCNDSVQRAIWGQENSLVGNMSTQEAVNTIVKRFLKNEDDYKEKAKEMGLLDYTETSSIIMDWYKAQFTC